MGVTVGRDLISNPEPNIPYGEYARSGGELERHQQDGHRRQASAHVAGGSARLGTFGSAPPAEIHLLHAGLGIGEKRRQA